MKRIKNLTNETKLSELFTSEAVYFGIQTADEKAAVVITGHSHGLVCSNWSNVTGGSSENPFPQFSYCRKFNFDSSVKTEVFFQWLKDVYSIEAELYNGAMPRATRAPRKVDFMAKGYETRVYTGIHGYHNSHTETQNVFVKGYFGHKIGIELEVEAKSREAREKISQWKSNWFHMERDGSLNENGVEFITIPLRPQEAKSKTFWKELCSPLATLAESYNSSRCGLHVHIGREILGNGAEERSATIGKLLYLYHHFIKDTRMNRGIFGRDRGYSDCDGKTVVGELCSTVSSKVFKVEGIADKVAKDMTDKSSTGRYFDINISNRNTIEFRKGKGTLKVERIVAIVEYCELMCKYARTVRWEDISYAHFCKFIRKKMSKSGTLGDYFVE